MKLLRNHIQLVFTKFLSLFCGFCDQCRARGYDLDFLIHLHYMFLVSQKHGKLKELYSIKNFKTSRCTFLLFLTKKNDEKTLQNFASLTQMKPLWKNLFYSSWRTNT